MATRHAQDERAALCELFDELGPDAPTLCEGWTTRDLAAHLVIRERRPDAAIGILLPFAAAYSERVRHKVADSDWPTLVDAVRNGPPAYFPTRIAAIDELANTNEFFVHHEDVRRAQPAWQPRDLDDGLSEALWSALCRIGRLTLRRAGVGVVLDDSNGRRRRLIDREPAVELRGPVGELVLFANGRQAHAQIGIDGPATAVERIRNAHLGI